ncbi:hypothetical protein AAG570_005363 [Ranatra chinensis]|uniref:Secernin-2 n=1 Tax=Ranatra chinensis TaxID=642074 RepID=A0ABD0YM04_9HEMI
MAAQAGPNSCDTFVVLPGLTERGAVIFGKNSDRPRGEVQEVIYVPKTTHPDGEKLQCTYIEIDQVSETKAVILSKPAWMWGAEMGANEDGVVIGNEAVWTVMDLKDDEKLLGMDLVRLGLERSGSAGEAVDVITSLLEKYGQGGPCSDSGPLSYHNSFLIADSSEAWVLETAGHLWAAQRITEGFRNISNCLSITTQIDRMAENLKSYAIENKYWNGNGDFNFKEAFESGGDCPRKEAGERLLQQLTEDGKFTVGRMFEILRNKDSDICRPYDSDMQTTGSQVSVLFKDKPNTHWFTATPDPSVSVFKPFMFTPDAKISQHTVSPTIENDPDRRHTLYRLHEAVVMSGGGDRVLAQLRGMETACVGEVDRFVDKTPDHNLPEVDELLKDVVETEVKFYK